MSGLCRPQNEENRKKHILNLHVANFADVTFYFERFCYFREDAGNNDLYVMRPFPSMWNCRIVHPYGLDPFSGDVRTLQGFSRSLEILTYMK